MVGIVVEVRMLNDRIIRFGCGSEARREFDLQLSRQMQLRRNGSKEGNRLLR